MRWDIRTFVSVGPLKFGMSSAEVAAFNSMIGEIRLTEFDEAKRPRIEHRPYYTPKCEYENGELSCVDTIKTKEFEIFWEDTDIYATPPSVLLPMLETRNGGPALIGLGFVYFDKLGLNLGGFWYEKTGQYYELDSEERDERGLAVFRPKAFDSLIPRLKAHSFLTPRK